MQTTDRLHRHLFWAVIMAESTHVFCCVIPTVVTLLSVLSGFGLMSSMPVVLLDLHEALHAYEIPVILFSGAMLALGWVLYGISQRIECAKDHCEPHETVCPPQKKLSRRVLFFATFLFVANVTVYFTVHHGLEALMHQQHEAAHDHAH